MHIDKLIALYRKLVNQSSVEVPEEVWHNISKMLDASSGADAAAGATANETADQDTLDDAWAGISNQLDIDEVWNNISAELDRDQKVVWLSRPVWRSMAAAMLLLLAVGSLVFLLLPARMEMPQHAHVVATDTLPTEDTLKSSGVSVDPISRSRERVALNDEKSDSGQSASTPSEANSGDALAPKPRPRTRSTAEWPGKPEPQERNIAAGHSDTEKLEMFDGTEVPDFARSLSLRALEVNTEINSTPRLHGDIGFEPRLTELSFAQRYEMPDVTLYDRKDSRWTLGIVSALKNTYLLNQKTINGFKPDNLRDSRMVFMPDIGVNAKYALNKKLILDVNLFLSSAARQDYREYINGKYLPTSTELNYLLTELSVKQNASSSFLTSEKIIRRNVAGVYMAGLRDAKENNGTVSSNVKNQYASFDYGVLVGQEFEFKTHSPLKITAGLTAKYGLKNVFDGSAEMPAHLHRTHNASVEFRIGVAWRFKSGNPADYYLGWLGK